MTELKQLRWKTIMASSNIISFQEKEKVDKNSSKRSMTSSPKKAQKLSSEKNILQNFFKQDNNQMMVVDEACDPEFILWRNIGFTE